jgi:simple sugar transport system permease protein
MATAATPTIQERPVPFWRDRIKINRTVVFSLFFIVVGALILLSAVNDFTPETTTTLTFGAGRGAIDVPTQPYALVVSFLYILGGLVGLLPQETGRLKQGWLLLNGILIIPTLLIVTAADASVNVVVMAQVSLRLATPIVIGAMAGLWCELSGVVNIAIEGMMLTGACFGFVFLSILSGRMSIPEAQLIGVMAALLSGGLMAALHAWLSITFKTSQIVSGTVINILAIGLTSFLRKEVLLSSEAGRETLPPIEIPVLADIPILGEIFFQGQPIFYGMFILLIVTHVVMYYTRWGLRTRAVGENPHAADTLGINVNRTRWINVIIGGMIAGLAGAWLSLERNGSFEDQMTAGRGFIALAAMIFGKWTPIGSAAGGLLFGFSDALGQRFQILGVAIPPQFLQMVPYVITMVVLAGLVGRANPPKADGIPYEKE